MIIFDRIKYSNFLSTGTKATEIRLNEVSSTLVVGQNGAGKSTMLDAMSFALFGKPYRKINKPQLVNSINDKNCLVEIWFSVNNVNFYVKRGIKPGIFEIHKEGKLLNQSSHNKEYQRILEQNILKLNHKSFHQIVVLGSSSFIPFMQLSANHRREVIEDLLDIGMFSKMNLILKEKNSALKNNLRDLDHQMELCDTKIASQKTYIRDITRINKDFRVQKEDKIREVRKEIKQLQAKNKELTNEIKTPSSTVAKSREGLQAQINTLRSVKSHDQAQLKAVMKTAKFFKENENCPTCEQAISDDMRKPKLRELRAEASMFDKDLKEREHELAHLLSQMDEIEEQIKAIDKRNKTIFLNDNLIDTHQNTIDNIQAEIANLNDDEGDLANAQRLLEDLQVECQDKVEQKNEMNTQVLYNSVVLEMLKDTGVKTKIIKQYLPAMNKLVNQYLGVLDFFVHFDLDENFNETIRSRHRDIFTYDSFSEGEKQRIDLALLFTWRHVAKMKNSVSTNLLVLDETFDSSLDQEGIENLMKIIYTLGDDTNVFVISHKGEILDGRLEAKLEFYKDKNFSKVR